MHIVDAHTPILRRAVAVAVGAVILAGCGSSGSSKPTVTTAPAGAETTAAEDPPASTNAPATPASVSGGAATISVTVGTDDFDTSNGNRVVSVPKGTSVTLELTNAAADDSYHLHGYDVDQGAKKGETAKIYFTADQTGQFDVESHISNKTLLVVLVV